MLEVKNIEKYYKKTKGVENLSFCLQKSKVLGIIGVNGSGKTTTLKVLLGLLKPSKGKITFNNEIIDQASLLFGYLPEERSLYKDISVYDQVFFLARLKKMKDIQILERLEYLLTLFRIPQYKFSKINTLSKGNQQKVQIICALIHNPKIIILDEPLSGLDINNANLFKDVILKLKREGKYIIISTHQFEYLEQICDDLLVLKKGDTTFYGSMNKLISKSEKYYIQVDKNIGENYLNYPEVIFFESSDKIITLHFNSLDSLNKVFNEINLKHNCNYLLKSKSSIEKVVKEFKLL